MSVAGARRILCAAGALLLPLPILAAAAGALPVARFALLGLVAGAYAALVDGSGIAWLVTGLLLGHAVVYGLAVWGAAALVARWLPDRARGAVVAGVVVLGLAVSLAFEIYRTPFAAESARANLLGLLP